MRFFISQSPQKHSIITLTGPEYHHLVHVYRVQLGMEVELFDSTGISYLAKVKACTGKEVELELINQNTNETQRLNQKSNQVEIILAQSVIKSQHWDLLLEKAMELGLDSLIPMLTQHLSVGIHTAGKEERWQRVMITAAKQCGRNHLIAIQPPQSFSQVLANTSNIPIRILAHKSPESRPLKHILETLTKPPLQILLMIGPEGGFSVQELSAAKDQGISFASLGENILRAETSAWAMISFIRMYFDPADRQ